MKRTRTTNAAIAATLLCFAPQVARADAAADARLAKLEARIGQLEDKLAKSEQTIAEQQALLSSQATPAVSAGSEPGSLDGFLNTVSVGGYASASYIYNNNNPDDSTYAQAFNQFDLDHNTFNIDGAKIELGRTAAASGEAGFQIDLMFGEYGGILGGYGLNYGGNPNDNSVYLQEAWASYNWNDVTLKLGKFETLLGYELIDSPYNRNVTHGVLFTYAIPLVHTGLLASGTFGEGFGWQAGVVNGWNNATDLNDNKGVLGQLSFAKGSFSTGLNAYYGSDGYTGFANAALDSVDSFNADRALVIDWTATVAATDTVTVWWNVDWGQQDDVSFGLTPLDPTDVEGPKAGQTDDATWYGAAVGTQVMFTDKASLAVRGEWFRDSDGYRMFIGDDTEVWTLTGTLGYKLTPNLLARFELRYDDFNTDDASDDVFPQGGGVDDHDFFGLLNVAYVFD